MKLHLFSLCPDKHFILPIPLILAILIDAYKSSGFSFQWQWILKVPWDFLKFVSLLTINYCFVLIFVSVLTSLSNSHALLYKVFTFHSLHNSFSFLSPGNSKYFHSFCTLPFIVANIWHVNCFDFYFEFSFRLPKLVAIYSSQYF